MKTLIIYYSHSGNTKVLCENLSMHVASDLARLRERRGYGRMTVYLTGLPAAMRGAGRAILPMEEDVSSYERIIVATPVWASHLAPPVVTFLRDYDLKGKEVYGLLSYASEIGNADSILKNEIEKAGGIVSGISAFQCTTETMHRIRDEKIHLIFDSDRGIRIESRE